MKPRASLIALVASLLFLAGCAGESAAEPSPAATATPAASSSSPDTAIEAPSEPVTSTYFIPTEELPRVRFHPSGAELPVEVPSRDEYAIGLSGRHSLEGRGMLFAFPDQATQPGFWMLNTHIDLDIAFVDEEGTIVAILTMEADTQEIHHPGQRYLVALEAAAGWYVEHGIEAGHTVEYLFDLEASLGR